LKGTHEDIRTNGDCCFNHMIGLPQKDGNDKPLYDYEQLIFDCLVTQNSNKHLWIKKATGLDISEFMLRFMAWLCIKDGALSGSQMCIVTAAICWQILSHLILKSLSSASLSILLAKVYLNNLL
jgi:hypothetical protein